MTDTRSRRLAPPELPGYTYVRQLGSGGFSDVYLYRQHMPQRDVAVKVLLQGAVGDADRARFAAEANVTASLASHPSIVTIHHAAVAGDGRPFLVMEYYPSENLRVRAQRERLSVSTVLSYGVQVACAVETAHRAGILHRDIKPANILVSHFNIPGLTDFGIAATVAEAANEADDAAGLSIPWSPPEVIRSAGSSDERSDVYSLGATLYTLLTGRSPFEVKGARNTSHDLMRRIESEAPQPLNRPDVPVSLERLLMQAMAKAPAARPPSALALAQALQTVESELSLHVTPLVIMQQPTQARDLEHTDDGATRLRPADRVIDAQAGPPVKPSTPPPVKPSTPPPASGHAGAASIPVPVPVPVPDDATHRAGTSPGTWTSLTPQPPASPLSAQERTTRRGAGPAPSHGGSEPTRTRAELRAMQTSADTRQTGRTAPEPSPAPGLLPTPDLLTTARPFQPAEPFQPPQLDDTSRRPAPAPAEPQRPNRRRGVTVAIAGAAALLVLGGIGTAVALSQGGTDGKRDADTSVPDLPQDPADPGSSGDALIERPAPVQELTLTPKGAGRYRVSWTNPDGVASDRFNWRRSDPGHETKADYTSVMHVTLTKVPAGERPCVEVIVVRNNEGSPVQSACATP